MVLPREPLKELNSREPLKEFDQNIYKLIIEADKFKANFLG